MLLTYTELVEFIENRIVENSRLDLVNAASIDICLGDKLLVEDTRHSGIVDLAKRESPAMRELELDSTGRWRLPPGAFALANTIELFHLPNNIAFEYKLKSSLARGGLGHALAGWADPGFHNATLTLELSNTLQNNWLYLTPGMRIGQIVFWRGAPVPLEASYASRGSYNGQRDPQVSKEAPV
jgi:dCTP deaminase